MSEYPIPNNKGSLKRKKEGIMDEDTYLERLEKIIKRDFFPDLINF
jgi:hypothetical protein